MVASSIPVDGKQSGPPVSLNTVKDAGLCACQHCYLNISCADARNALANGRSRTCPAYAWLTSVNSITVLRETAPMLTCVSCRSARCVQGITLNEMAPFSAAESYQTRS